MLGPEARPARTLDGLKEALCLLIGSLDRLREASNLKMTFALLCCAIGEVLKAQAPLSPKAEQLALAMFDGKIAGDKLDCNAKPGRVFFDFAFRFELSYVVTCPYSQFRGELDHFAAVTRVRSLNEGKFVILGDSYQVPALPASIRTKPNIRRYRGRLEFSGAIGVGEGEYTIELLVVDEHRRFYRKNWKVRTRRRGGEKKAEGGKWAHWRHQGVSLFVYKSWHLFFVFIPPLWLLLPMFEDITCIGEENRRQLLFLPR